MVLWYQSVKFRYSLIFSNLFWTFYLWQNLLFIYYLFTNKIYIIRLKSQYCVFYLFNVKHISGHVILVHHIVLKYAAFDMRIGTKWRVRNSCIFARNLYFTYRPWNLYLIIWIIYVYSKKYKKKQIRNFVISLCLSVCPSIRPSVCMCVCLSARMEQQGSHWKDFNYVWYLSF